MRHRLNARSTTILGGIMLAASLCLAFAACGAPTVPTSGAASAATATSETDATGTPPSESITATPGRAPYTPTPRPASALTTTGCPAPNAVGLWPNPNAILSAATTTTVRVGQTLELTLPFGHRYALLDSQGAPALALNVPAGFGDAGQSQCVWYWRAVQAGQVTLQVSVGSLCPTQTCSGTIVLVSYAVTVTN